MTPKHGSPSADWRSDMLARIRALIERPTPR